MCTQKGNQVLLWLVIQTPPFPAASPELKEPRESIVWEEASLWPRSEEDSSGGSELTAELKYWVVSWVEDVERPGEYGGLKPTAVFGRLVGMAPWTEFWWIEKIISTFTLICTHIIVYITYCVFATLPICIFVFIICILSCRCHSVAL